MNTHIIQKRDLIAMLAPFPDDTKVMAQTETLESNVDGKLVSYFTWHPIDGAMRDNYAGVVLLKCLP